MRGTDHGPADADRPDWDRYGSTHSRATDNSGVDETPLGDATRWGAEAIIALPGTVAEGAALGTFASAQLVRVQTIDPYSRHWTLLGNVAALQDFWDTDPADAEIYLEVIMGVGQASVTQNFDLRALTDLAAPWYVADELGAYIVKPWVISGGLIGRAVSARVVIRVLALVLAYPNQKIAVSALISPFAAGSGI